MYIKRIVVRNFRNLENIDIPLAPGVSCVIGENNTGKSNFLHALRLVLDPAFSSQNRRLETTDFSIGVDHSVPSQIMISVEFGDFADSPKERATLYLCEVDSDTARLTYRFRPRADIRTAIESGERSADGLSIDDYHWELVGGGDTDPVVLNWSDDYGRWVRFDEINQSFVVVFMEALRDVAARLRQARLSPLGKLIEVGGISETDKVALVAILTGANADIAASPSIASLADEIQKALSDAAGSAFTLGTQLGMSGADFNAVARSLELLLSSDSHKNFTITQNGLGLNNVLYVSMLLSYFKRRIAAGQSAGNLLLVEEPEAHLHPQLQRVLFNSLKTLGFQVITTTHSTHISSQCGMDNQVILSNVGTAASHVVAGSTLPLDPQQKADIERYLDATRSVLLYARRVMLVEGPAELYLLPTLIKQVLGIDLDRAGITIVAIHGVHFEEYAALFGSTAMPKRCAIVADGDAVSSDALRDVDDGDLPSVTVRDYSNIENAFVKAFVSRTTLERELALPGNLEMFANTAVALGAPKVGTKLRAWQSALGPGVDVDTQLNALSEAGEKILRTAQRFGKARFAQVASRYVQPGCELPTYVAEAVQWLTKE